LQVLGFGLQAASFTVELPDCRRRFQGNRRRWKRSVQWACGSTGQQCVRHTKYGVPSTQYRVRRTWPCSLEWFFVMPHKCGTLTRWTRNRQPWTWNL